MTYLIVTMIDQRPDDQRQHAENPRRGDRGAIVEALLDGVERRGADIAIDDAQRRDRQVLAGC